MNTRDPADPGNFIEAINELAADDKFASRLDLLLSRIEKALDPDAANVDAQYQMIGMHLVGFLKDYWTRYARNQAETEIEGECTNCFGKGCRQCEAPEQD